MTSSIAGQSWLTTLVLAQSHRSRSSLMDSFSRRFLAVVEEFPCRRFSCPFSTTLRCRLFSKIEKNSFVNLFFVEFRQLTVIFMLILMVSPSLNPRSS
jgi:hypothetical protein